MSIRLAIVEITRQVRASSPVARRAVAIGMIADDNAPAATSWNIRSGSRKAARNASRSPLAPKYSTMTT